MEALLGFLLTTKLGRTIASVVLIGLGVLISWLIFASHYKQVGRDECMAERANVQNSSNVAQANLNNQSNEMSSTVANEADKAGAAVIANTDNTVTTGKENVHVIYRDPPRTAPVRLGSCVHPVDERVQARLDEARRAANGAAGNP